MLEPVSAGMYNITYACLLVPRFSNHYLTGDMADRVSEWLPQICIAFGWRLEYLAVRPEYVQWVLNVPPATSPDYLMRIVRQQTSEKIFIEFMLNKNGWNVSRTAQELDIQRSHLYNKMERYGIRKTEDE